MLSGIEKKISSSANALNWIAAAAVAGMMVLTCADVILRLFRLPIPGTYEMVGFLGAVFVSFSLAKTSMDQGHIAVDFFVNRLPRKARRIISVFNLSASAVLFGIAAWQSAIYAMDLKNAGEVSLTLQMPIYPFVYGTSAGCGILCVVLIFQLVKTLLHKGDK